MFAEIEDVIPIGSDLYVKNHEALEQLSGFLDQEYDVFFVPKGRYEVRIKDSILVKRWECDCGLCVDPREVRIHQQQCNEHIYLVKIYQGKKYQEFDTLPVYEWYTIIEAWYWAPLPRSKTLYKDIIGAVHMPTEISFYDHRRAFFAEHLEGMRTFVEHFTYLNLKEWDRMIRKTADRSGTGLIKAIAEFCGSR